MRERHIKLDDVITLIREQLAAGQSVTFSPRGTSMLPFLCEGRDTVTLSSPPEKLKKYDVALYQRKNGQYVLHRVVGVKGKYTFLGDNQFALEKGIDESQIIAVCSSFVRKGKNISADSAKWRIWAMLWFHSRLLRRIIRAALRRITAAWRKIKGCFGA